MGMYGYTWVYMDIREYVNYVWMYVGIYGCTWVCMDVFMNEGKIQPILTNTSLCIRTRSSSIFQRSFVRGTLTSCE